jgi:23S rRNA (cytidine1920-2'-O)/16S rRNA (cytidine1409-2'-O)-methyltransferase
LKQRLDYYLTDHDMVPSRNIAQQLIKSGKISVDGKITTKASFQVDEMMTISRADEHIYVGRAALKLKAFLELFPMDIKGKKAIDVGSSTGGFTEILLEQNVASVVCVDVGKDQLHERIRNDQRVRSVEEQDIRSFESEPFELLTCDVSFISLHNILESLDRLSSRDIVILFKPQFEVGNDVKRNRAGVVQDDKAIVNSQVRFEDAAQLLGWKLIEKSPSQVEGKEGNREYFYHFEKC